MMSYLWHAEGRPWRTSKEGGKTQYVIFVAEGGRLIAGWDIFRQSQVNVPRTGAQISELVEVPPTHIPSFLNPELALREGL